MPNPNGRKKEAHLKKIGGFRKMKKTIALVLALMMVFALALPTFAAPDPKPGDPMWNDIYKGAGATVIAQESAKTDASGDKIASNAQSGDVPGIYFYWDDNNKSVLDATLLVADDFFNLIKGVEGERKFTITAKNSNAYWDYVIVEGEGNVLIPDSGVSAYKIPRYLMYLDKKGKEVKEELKNINMIFISGNWIDAELEIEKVWYDEEDNVFDGDNDLVTFNSPFELGSNTVEVKSLFGTTYSIKENSISGFTTKKNPISVTVKPGDKKTVTFENQKQWANIEIVKVWLDVDGDVMEAPEKISAGFAIDDTVAVLGNNQVKEGAYTVSELLPIPGFELVSDNDLEITVAAGESKTVTFTNKEVEFTEEGLLNLAKYIDGVFSADWDDKELTIADIIDMISFKLYKVAGKDADILAENLITFDGENSVKLGLDGMISFGEVPLGWYAIVEVLSEDGAKLFEQAEPLYVQMDAFGVVGDARTIVSGGPGLGTLVSHNGTGVNWVLPDVWNEQLAGQDAFEALTAMGAQWVWDVENTYVYGEDGNKYVLRFDVSVDEAVSVPFYFACDNVAVIYVNGKLAGFTDIALSDSTYNLAIGDAYDPYLFTLLDKGAFDGRWNEGWTHSYEIGIDLEKGENEIVIVAANSIRTEGTGTDNDSYNLTNNPCGVIFGFEIAGEVVFENTTIFTEEGILNLEKKVDGDLLADWCYDGDKDILDIIAMMSFDLYAVESEGDEWSGDPIVADATVGADGVITFGQVPAGWYVVVEKLTAEGKEIFIEADPLYIEMFDENIDGVFDNTTVPPTPGIDVYDKIPSKTHVDRWWDGFGILAYGASSATDKDTYGFAFADGFWDDNESVTIGFGTKDSWTYIVTITYVDDKLICDADGFVFRDYYGGSVTFDSHFGGRGKSYSYDISVGAALDNPYFAGAMQLWLLQVQPK